MAPQTVDGYSADRGGGDGDRPVLGPDASSRIPVTEPVTMHNGYYLIDTGAWLDQRTGIHLADLTARLQDFVHCDVFDEHRPCLGIAARLRLWCAAQGYEVGDGAVIEHDIEGLTKPVTIVLATGPARHALALVSVEGGDPQVHADVTTDDGVWLDADTIALRCPSGRTWTWDGGDYLHDTADGSELTVRELYGPNTGVISRCRDCAAFDDGATDRPCLCPGVAVYCPACGRRCQVTLPEIPTFEESR